MSASPLISLSESKSGCNEDQLLETDRARWECGRAKNSLSHCIICKHVLWESFMRSYCWLRNADCSCIICDWNDRSMYLRVREVLRMDICSANAFQSRMKGMTRSQKPGNVLPCRECSSLLRCGPEGNEAREEGMGEATKKGQRPQERRQCPGKPTMA